MGVRNGFAVAVAMAMLTAACSSGGDTAPAPTSAQNSAKAGAKTTSAPPTRTVDPNHVTAKDALGDFATVEPCSMVPLTDLPAEYTKSAAPFPIPPPSVDTCSLALTLGPDQFVTVDWGLLESRSTLTKREQPAHSRSLGHGLSLVRSADRPDECRQYLVFADDIAMAVDAYTHEKSTKLCGTGKAVADLIVKTLLVRAPAKRVVRDSSLTHQDACAMLTPEIVALLPGAAGAKLDRDYPAHHSCHYMGPHLESVSLIFGMSESEYEPDEGETAVKVAGKQTYQYDDHDSGCQLITQSPAGGTSTNGFAETLKLIVITDGGSSACKQATKLAEKLWSKLPAA
jgi:hypothetical protein